MRRLCFAEREWIAMVAAGAFSFRYEGEKLTTARGVTFFASTYSAMVQLGWGEKI
jgi:hypothetical protein